MTKLSQRELFMALIVNLKGETPMDKDGNPISAEMMIEGLEGRIAQLDKKNASSKSGERKPTKTQIENGAIKEKIAEFLYDVDRATCSEIAKALDISTQKCSALLKQIEDVDKTVEKGKSYFSIKEDTRQWLDREVTV